MKKKKGAPIMPTISTQFIVAGICVVVGLLLALLVRPTASYLGSALLFSAVTYLEPATWYRLNPGETRPTRLSISSSTTADYSDSEVVREFATSKDGTKVPINIIRRKGTVLNGNNPDTPDRLRGIWPFGEARISTRAARLARTRWRFRASESSWGWRVR